MTIESLILHFKEEFEEDFSKCNTMRLGSVILHRCPDGYYVTFDVSKKEWSIDNYVELFESNPYKLTFCQPRQYVFRSTYLGEFLNTYMIQEDLTSKDFAFLFKDNEFIVEQAIKMGIPFILKAFRNGCSQILKNMNTTSLTKAVEMSPKQLLLFQDKVQTTKQDALYYFLRLGRIAPTFKGLQEDVFSKMCDITLNDDVTNTDLDLYQELILSKPGGLVKKLEKVIGYINSNFTEYHAAWTTLKDLNHLDESEYPLLPKVDKISELTGLMRLKIVELEDEAKYHALNQKLQQVLPLLQRFTFTGSKYSIVAPQVIQELDVEGETLHHCVGSYKYNVASGKEIILFLRKNDDLKTPFYTIDLDPEGYIRQIHTKYNGDIKDDPEKDEIKGFLDSWGLAKSDIVNRKSIKLSYGALCAMQNDTQQEIDFEEE